MTIAAGHHVGLGLGCSHAVMQSCRMTGRTKKNQTKFTCGSHVAPSPAPVMQKPVMGFPPASSSLKTNTLRQKKRKKKKVKRKRRKREKKESKKKKTDYYVGERVKVNKLKYNGLLGFRAKIFFHYVPYNTQAP